MEPTVCTMQLLYNVVLHSAVLQSISCVRVYKHTLLFEFPSNLGHHRALRTVPCATQIVLVSYQDIIFQNIQTDNAAQYKKNLNQKTGRSKVCSIYLCLFFRLAYMLIATIFLNSIYMR